ncbi:MAG: ABC transporter permease [Planctomycetota bacterium]
MHISYGKKVLQSGIGRAGLIILSTLLLLAVIGPWISADPMQQTEDVLQAPSTRHFSGTDDVGHDVWARLVMGARTSLLVATGAGLLSTVLSAAVGISSGWTGGLYDRFSMRLVDAVLVMPTILVLILLSAFIQPTLFGLIVLISGLQWAGGARVLRAQTLTLKERPHVRAAQSFGAGPLHILARHIVPDLGPLLIVSFIHRARRAVFMEAGLAFIGIVAPSVISWGMMIRNALGFYYTSAWTWWLLPPGICLSLMILSFLFIGYALETIMEPRLSNA